MIVDLREFEGPWEKAFALHKHTLSSTYLGEDEFGHARFDTTRSEPGEAVYQLKYKSDWSKATELAAAIKDHIIPKLGTIGLIVPMPASTPRPRQPVAEVCKTLALLMGVLSFDNTILSKAPGPALKNIKDKAAKVAALAGQMQIADGIGGDGSWNALLVDDLFDSGASMEAACNALLGYKKIAKVYAVALTWK